MKRKVDFVMKNVGGENLLVPIGNQVMDLNGMITLNETGAFVWDLLADECTENELAKAVASQFDIEIEAAQVDVEIFLEGISKMGLLEE